jgi:hypothetical protein
MHYPGMVNACARYIKVILKIGYNNGKAFFMQAVYALRINGFKVDDPLKLFTQQSVIIYQALQWRIRTDHQEFMAETRVQECVLYPLKYPQALSAPLMLI